MPIILTPEYAIAVIAALILCAIAKRIGLHRALVWPLSIVVIVITLWLFGLNPLGFAVSFGGWIMFLATIVVGWAVQAIVTRATR